MKSNLFLIVGEDKKLIDFHLFTILSKIEYDENNKIVYDMDVNSFMDVMEEASMVSLFSFKKVIVVENFSIDILAESELSYLEKFIKGKVDDGVMIFISKKVDARKSGYKLFKENFTILSADKASELEETLRNYVIRKVNDKGYEMDGMLVDSFLSKTGNDINNVNQELEKLFLYKIEDKKICREDVDKLTFDTIDNVIYEFTNAILDRDTDKVKRMYDQFMLDNVSIDYLIAAVGGSFRTSFLIKLLNRKGVSNLDIGKIIGKKEFFVKKSLDRLYSYTLEDIGNCICKLAAIDRGIKSGMDNVGWFSLFLFDMDSIKI